MNFFSTGVSFDIKGNAIFYDILYLQVSKLQGGIATYNQLFHLVVTIYVAWIAFQTIVLHLSITHLISIAIELIF